MSDIPMGVRQPRAARLARDLRAGDKVEINRELMTVRYVSSRQARIDHRAMSMMTRGQDLEPMISVDLLNSQGRQCSYEFNAGQIVVVL